MKVKDQGYSLPLIEALSPHETFTTGANKPLLITGVDGNGVKDDYVLKFKAAERMSYEACMRELLAIFIAKQLDINSVEPAIINVSQPFIELLVGKDSWKPASKSLGYNFGSKYKKGYNTLITGQPLNNNELVAAQAIFVFDVFVQNSDRTNSKPNMMTNGQEIIIYDHELAFGFIFDTIKNAKPWVVRESDLQWINRHTLLTKIKGKEFDFDEFSRRFDTLDETFWQAAWNLIPNQWRSDQFVIIREVLSSICNNKEIFIVELKKLMS